MPDSNMTIAGQVLALRGQIAHHEHFGLPHEVAVRAVACINGLSPAVVSSLLAHASGR